MALTLLIATNQLLEFRDPFLLQCQFLKGMPMFRTVSILKCKTFYMSAAFLPTQSAFRA